MSEESFCLTYQQEVTSRLLNCESQAFAELGKELLSKNLGIKFQARGGSMRPLVRDGEVVLVKQVNPQDVKLGDALLFVIESGKAVLHRVIRIKKSTQTRSFLMQGDHSSRPDGWISGEHIMGKLLMIERNHKTIWMDQPIMRLLSKLVLWESRINIKNTRLGQMFIGLLKRCPGLSTYLA